MKNFGVRSRSRAFSSIGERSDLSCFADAEDFKSCVKSKHSDKDKTMSLLSENKSADLPFQTASSKTHPISSLTPKMNLM